MKIPFHRRILPWLFTIIFIVMAPTLVFYTAGYRWNQNKGVIERNGTIIFDTVPRGASITLNGQALKQVTPYTMQNVAPGTYDIALSLEGYHSWSKTLPVEPERVTFATEVYLWPDVQPMLVREGTFHSVFANDERTEVMTVSEPKDGKVAYEIWDAENLEQKSKTELNSDFLPNQADWDAAGDGVLLFGQASSVQQTWFSQTAKIAPYKMPSGIYHWDGSEMIGFPQDQKITVKSDGSVEHAPQDKSIRDSMDGFYVRYVTGTANMVLTIGLKTDKGFVLPAGEWQFRDRSNNSILLQNGREWQWVDLSTDPLSVNRLNADWLWPITIKRQTKYLALNQNEIYVWENGKEPDLIYRQSEPLVACAWHQDGKDIFVASKNEFMTFNLDARNGRVKTLLATFDEIRSAAVLDDTALIAGTKDGKSGIWKMPLTTVRTVLPTLGKF